MSDIQIWDKWLVHTQLDSKIKDEFWCHIVMQLLKKTISGGCNAPLACVLLSLFEVAL